MTSEQQPAWLSELLANRGWLRNFALRLVFNRVDADDLAAEVEAAVVEARPDEIRSFRAYLAGIARNKSKAFFRGRRNREKRELRAASMDEAPSAGELVLKAELTREIYDAIGRLPDELKQVFVLKFVELWTYDRMATKLGVSRRTLVERVNHARERVRVDLTRRLGGDRGHLGIALLPLLALPRGTRIDAVRRVLRYRAAVRLARWPSVAAATLLCVVGVAALVGGGGAEARVADGRPLVAEETTEASGVTEDGGPTGRVVRTGEARAGDELASGFTSRGSVPPNISRRHAGRLQVVVARPDSQIGDVPVVVTGIASDGSGALPSHRLLANDGELEVALSLLAPAGVPIAEVAVLVDHPELVPTQMRAQIGAAERVRADITTVRAAILEGLVGVDSDTTLGDVRVAVLDPESMRIVDRAVPNPAGVFRLRAHPLNPCLVVAVAPGARPAYRFLERPDDVARGGLEFWLDTGDVLRGTLKLPLEWQGDAAVDVTADVSGSRFVLNGQHLVLVDGRVIRRRARVGVEVDGSFTVGGLGAGFHFVAPYVMGLVPDLRNASIVHAAPSEGPVTVAVLGSTLRVVVRLGGMPVRDAIVRIGHDGGGTGGRTDASGAMRLLVSPDTEYQVRAGNEDGKARAQRVRGPPEGTFGEIQLDLDRDLTGCLRAHVLGNGGLPVGAVTFGIFEPGERMPRFLRSLQATDGRYVIDALPRGRWRVVARAGFGWFDPVPVLLDDEAVVEFGDTAELVEFSLRPAARLQVSFGGKRPARADRFALTSLSGDALPHSLVARDLDGGWAVFAGGLPSDRRLLTLFPALAPGTYFLSVGRGVADARQTTRVDLRAGDRLVVELP